MFNYMRKRSEEGEITKLFLRSEQAQILVLLNLSNKSLLIVLRVTCVIVTDMLDPINFQIADKEIKDAFSKKIMLVNIMKN